MGGLAAAMGNESAPVTIRWQGRDYPMRMSWVGVIDVLEVWLIEREFAAQYATWKRLMADGLMTPPELVERATAFNDDALNKGRYGFGSRRMMAIFQFAGTEDDESPEKDEAAKKPRKSLDGGSIGGFLKFASLSLGQDMNATAAMFADLGHEMMLKVQQLLARALPTSKEADDAPKEPGAVLTDVSR